MDSPSRSWAPQSRAVASGVLAMAAVVLALRGWIGEWTAISGWQHRIAWLALVMGGTPRR